MSTTRKKPAVQSTSSRSGKHVDTGSGKGRLVPIRTSIPCVTAFMRDDPEFLTERIDLMENRLQDVRAMLLALSGFVATLRDSTQVDPRMVIQRAARLASDPAFAIDLADLDRTIVESVLAALLRCIET